MGLEGIRADAAVRMKAGVRASQFGELGVEGSQVLPVT